MILGSFKTTQTKNPKNYFLGFFLSLNFQIINSFPEAAQLSLSRNIPPALHSIYCIFPKK
jgi:hypothetical protein